MKKYVKWIVAAVMIVTFMVAYLTEYRHVIIFHEQHHLFLFSADYLRSMSHEKGIWWPVMEFVVQFSYLPWLGALVWSLLFAATYLMSQSIIRRLTGLRDLIQLSAILPCWMFFQTVDVDMQPIAPVKAFAIVFGIWILALIIGRFLPWTRKAEGAEKAKDGDGPWWWIPVGVLAFSAVFAYWVQDYYRPRTIDNNGRKIELSREDVAKWRKNEKNMIMADQAVRRGDWDEVLDLSNQVLRTGNNHLMAYFRSLALYHRGELTSHLFDLPQTFSEQALFFPWTADRNKAEYGGTVYEQLGALNTAIHWEFEALVGWGETAWHLVNLSKYLVEAGKPKQAEKFLAPLKRTLFYRGTAKDIEGYMAAGDVPGLKDAMKGAPDSIHRWDNVYNIGADAKYILGFDPENEMAREYLMMSMLLANNVGVFYKNLKTFYTPGQELPRYFWEALCLLRLQYGSERLASEGWVIPEEVDRDFRAYVAEQNKGRAARYSPSQKQTYWYYATQISRFRPTIFIDENVMDETLQIHSEKAS